MIKQTQVALCALMAGMALAATGAAAAQAAPRTYEVLAKEGASDSAVRSAITKAGGTVTSVNQDVGLYSVTTDTATFATKANSATAVAGVAANRTIGRAPNTELPKRFDESAAAERKQAARQRRGRPPYAPRRGEDTLESLQWDMAMIHTSAAQRVTSGRGVTVGVMDTGVDGSHPDIAPVFNRRLSRNFTTDIEDIDGACADDPDGSCSDPADVDEDGHGTHVAGTIAAARNGRGIVGIAPEASIVNLRAGQDSGYFFLKPFVDGMTYASKTDIDVINMSFYIDPWLYNCTANPADSPEEQAEQRTIIQAASRAVRLANRSGITLVAAAGNENTDIDNPTFDGTSPDYPVDTEHDRTIDNGCVDMPVEAEGVISVSAVGPSKIKADYSNWGQNDVDVAAPGGWYRDGFGTDAFKTAPNLILSSVPKAVAIAELRDLDAYDEITGESSDPFTVSDCPRGKNSCAYYDYYQGTSMASPHAAGVAALIVGRYGWRDRSGGRQLDPRVVRATLLGTAEPNACPPAGFTYPERDSAEYHPDSCVGGPRNNSWYGTGIVDARNAVSGVRGLFP